MNNVLSFESNYDNETCTNNIRIKIEDASDVNGYKVYGIRLHDKHSTCDGYYTVFNSFAKMLCNKYLAKTLEEDTYEILNN